jgi:glycosidase
VADTARHSIFGRLPVDWANGDTPAGKERFAFCQRLCAMRRSEPALTTGEVVWLDNDQPEAAISFLRRGAGGEIMTVVNVSNRPISVKVDLPANCRVLLSCGAKVAPPTLDLAAFGYFIGKARAKPQ